MLSKRINSIDLLRGLVMVIMALDHVRMYFGLGTWYSDPTNLAETTPLLFFTRWITHFCAPAFVFLAGTSAYLRGTKLPDTKSLSKFLFTRGLWLVFVELVIVNFAWTFDSTYSYRILQVIWAIGISMIVLSGLVFLPTKWIAVIGLILVFGHNILDPIKAFGAFPKDILWYILHQDKTLLGSSTIAFHYPVLPWIGLMALGYTLGTLYIPTFDESKRKKWLLWTGIGAALLFILLRGFNLYGEPSAWAEQASSTFTLISFLNTTKYPPSLQFLLMTMGPVLIFLSVSEAWRNRIANALIVFGKVPFFFYILHLYLIHALAMLALVLAGRDWHEYILSGTGIRSGSLINFGFGLGTVYSIWILVVLVLYPLCRWYQRYRESNPQKWWLSYL
ncbi:MAG: heparan-alpha-glucosaminide N-acetyltransferase domain-containing protein [Anaerolineales bacterium]